MCGHSIEIHRDGVNANSNNAFATLLHNQLPQCPIASNEFNVDNTNQGPPTPNHRNFVPIIDGHTSETIACAAASNDHEATLNKEFDSRE